MAYEVLNMLFDANVRRLSCTPFYVCLPFNVLLFLFTLFTGSCTLCWVLYFSKVYVTGGWLYGSLGQTVKRHAGGRKFGSNR